MTFGNVVETHAADLERVRKNNAPISGDESCCFFMQKLRPQFHQPRMFADGDQNIAGRSVWTFSNYEYYDSEASRLIQIVRAHTTLLRSARHMAPVQNSSPLIWSNGPRSYTGDGGQQGSLKPHLSLQGPNNT